jgi:CBS domain-containing protein
MKSRATVDLVSLRDLQSKREALRGSELFSYSEDLRSVMASPVLTCGPEESVKSAVEKMASGGVSSVVIVDDRLEPLGILTDRDIMRRIVRSERFDIATTPVSSVMTSELIMLTPDDTLYRALFLLSSKGIKHLPLVEPEKGGRLAGIVTMRQLLKLRYPEPMTMISAISVATELEALAEIKKKMPRVAAIRLSRAARAYDVAVMLSLVNQDLHRKAIEIVLESLGEPPVEFSIFVTGSHGRLENLLATDQDWGLVIADQTGNSTDESVSAGYFAAFSERLVDALERVGFERCSGEVMGVNPIWRKNLGSWKVQLTHWIEAQVPNLGRYMTVLFDARHLCGKGELFDGLMDHAFDLLARHHEVLRILHEEESGHRVPTGLLGRFITERSGEHRGKFDLKRSGLIFVVEGIRILALRHGIRETSTLRRIAKLVEAGGLHSDDGEYFEGAFRFLLHYALDAQVGKAMEHEEVDTYVNPNLLSPRNQEMLRHAYKAVSRLQDLIAGEFGKLVI